MRTNAAAIAAVLSIVAVAVWLHWPGGAGFKADDWAAIHYASSAASCAHDFVGPQYGIGTFLFYRPLITLSFGIDYALFGTAPFGYYAMNAVLMVATALLAFAILRLLVPGRHGLVLALVVALLWVCHPVLVVSLRWVAGRVDTHSAPWILLALWLHLRARRGAKTWPTWVAACAALASKESAIGLPLLALGLDLLDPHPSLRPAPALFGRALPALPLVVLIPAFLALRWIVLGTPLGGYAFTAGIEPLPALDGLRNTVAEVLKPELPGLGRSMPALLVAVAVLLWVLRAQGAAMRGARILGALLVAGGLFGPLATVLPSMRGGGDLRFAYLASLGVLAVWGALAITVGRRNLVLAIVLGLVPLVWLLPARRAQRALLDGHDRFNHRLVDAIQRCDALLPPGAPVVVAGDAEQLRHPQRFLWGLGAVCRPPFRRSDRDAVSLHALVLQHEHVAPVPAALAAGGLPAHVVVDGDSVRVEVPPRPNGASTRAAPEVVGFDGTLRAPDVARLADATQNEAIGFRVRGSAPKQVAVCSSVGSLLVAVTPIRGVLPIAHVLAADASARRASFDSVLAQAWWGWDLGLPTGSPLWLFFEDNGRVACAQVHATPGFLQAVRPGLKLYE